MMIFLLSSTIILQSVWLMCTDSAHVVIYKFVYKKIGNSGVNYYYCMVIYLKKKRTT